MKQILTNIYLLEELSEEAQYHAYSEWLKRFEYFWDGDNEKTKNAFLEAFGAEKGVRYLEEADLIGRRAYAKLYDNYITNCLGGRFYYKGKAKRHSRIFFEEDLTGYYMDNIILAPLREYLSKPDFSLTYAEVLNQCLRAYERGVCDDIEYCQSFEVFKENSIDTYYTIKGDKYYE